VVSALLTQSLTLLSAASATFPGCYTHGISFLNIRIPIVMMRAMSLSPDLDVIEMRKEAE
jgi:hypothetical protein